ncbi:MAG: SDR family oxidoreductase, partial [Actinobacteria bacterium]|nr:SDR family oxidoreductase [Actinomycetota bacterium]
MSGPRTVVVTGGAGGIGAAVIDRFTSAGWVCCSLDLVARAGSAHCHSITADLRTAAACRDAVADAVQRLGRLDAVVNAAGVWHEGDTAATTETDFDRVIDVNLKGTYFVSAAAIPHLESTRGCIVNLSSDAGIQGNSGAAAYCASKGGVSVFTKALALELAPRGVRVNAVCPGDVDSPMLRGQARDYGGGEQQYYDRLLAGYPQGRHA